MPRRSRPRRRANRRINLAQITASEKAREYILREFFDLDPHTFSRVIDLYGREHGRGAQKYFEATYEKWRHGRVQPSSSTQNRILRCVPRFLSHEKQFTILNFYIPSYVTQLRTACKMHRLAPDEVPEAFASAAKRCLDTPPSLDWFVKGVFSDAELTAFSNVVRFTVLDRFRRAYAAVRMDLSSIEEYLNDLDAKLTLTYRIAELGGLVELSDGVSSLPATAFELPPAPDLVVRHRAHYETLLIEHFCEMHVETEAQIARQEVAHLDLSVLRSAIDTVSKRDSMDSSFEVTGAGGTFQGIVSRKNLTRLKAQLFARIATAVVCSGVIGIGIVALLRTKGLRDLAPCGILGVLGVIPALWSWVIEKYEEVRDYERGRRSRIAEIEH